jgi:hypothetical protein
MNWSKTESTTTRTDSDSTNGALNSSAGFIQHPLLLDAPGLIVYPFEIRGN